MDAKLDHAHFNMVAQQVRPGDVLDNNVLAAMTDIPREQFVDAEFSALAYADTELPIGCGQLMLSPVIEGRLAQALQLKKTDEVLEIGTGSGYFTALLAYLSDHVTSVELYPELSKQAEQRLAACHIENVTLQVGDASRNWHVEDRVDVIVFTAAFTSVPEEYQHKLKVGGKMLVVVGKAPTMSVQLIFRVNEWEWQIENLFETVIPPMVNAEPKPEFEF